MQSGRKEGREKKERSERREGREGKEEEEYEPTKTKMEGKGETDGDEDANELMNTWRQRASFALRASSAILLKGFICKGGSSGSFNEDESSRSFYSVE